ncbi:MAG: hypothetical protein Ta2B_27550 [Termitinemataceae bacterium]|nr:MAG: hypothetical protein Ta2B_27550 [Termitinemataceae bacterium]
MIYDYCVIMAGGQGTRLWPASNSSKPKQFLSIPEESGASIRQSQKTFFSAAVERALSVTNEQSRILIIAGFTHQKNVEIECEQFTSAERSRIIFIGEPCAKNTAAALAMTAVFCSLHASKEPQQGAGRRQSVLVLTSDHIIEPLEVFSRQALSLCDYIDKSLAVFGIIPSTPETGFGYIEAADNTVCTNSKPQSSSGCRTAELNTFIESKPMQVVSFHEKPNRETAEKYLQDGTFFWNSGMFAFSVNFILDEFRKHSPDVLSPFEKLACPTDDSYQNVKGLRVLSNWHGLKDAYQSTKNISFDYAVVEKCISVIMCKAEFSWCDVGSWDVYADLSQKNCALQKEAVFTVCAKNNFVMSDIPVALCGCDDLVVVIKNGSSGDAPVALIAKKGETQKIRDIVEQIKASGRGELL